MPLDASETSARRPSRRGGRGVLPFVGNAAGLIWRERQSVGRGFILSRRAALLLVRAHETAAAMSSCDGAEGDDEGDDSARRAAAALAAFDGERMPRADDHDSHSPSSQSPVKRRVRAESDTSAPNLSRRASSAGASAAYDDGVDGGDGDADDAAFAETTDFEVVDAASSARATAAEPFSKCFRLLAFFYRDAGRDAAKQTLPLPAIEDYWSLTVREDVPSARTAVLLDADADEGACAECGAERHAGEDVCAAPFGAHARVLTSKSAEDGSRAFVAWDFAAATTTTTVTTETPDARHATAWTTLDWLRGRVSGTAPVSAAAVKRSAAALTPQVPADLPPTLSGAQVFGLYFAPFAWQRVGAGAGSSRHVV